MALKCDPPAAAAIIEVREISNNSISSNSVMEHKRIPEAGPIKFMTPSLGKWFIRKQHQSILLPTCSGTHLET